MGYRVFICYRRDNKDFARNIERELVAEFGDGAVFLDTDEIRGGEHWKEEVVKVLEDEPVVITLITTKWNSRRNGKPKLLYEEDYVRFELEAALERGLSVVPVLYEPANWPKEDTLPQTLRPVLGFQRVRFSNDRWKNDAGELKRALVSLGVAGQTAAVEAQTPPGPSAPFAQLPTTLYPSMFREEPAARQERLAKYRAAAQAERERKKRARARAEPFYARWEFWTAAVVTTAAGAGAVVGAEALTRTIADRWTSLPDPPIVAALVLVAVWAAAWTGMGAAAYWDDPARGPWVFYRRGLLGGYGFWNSKWTAFPIATLVAWCLARAIAWLPNHGQGWNYDLIFWLVLAAYTLPAVGVYVTQSLDTTDLNLL